MTTQSSLDVCRLSVVGSPGARYGKYTKDKEGTVREFIVDRGQAYTLVYQHVKKCPQCSPDEVLRAFLDNRNTEKKGGLVSTGLQKFAAKMARIPGKRVSPDILLEFEWRSGDFGGIVRNRRITASQAVQGAVLIFRSLERQIRVNQSHGRVVPKKPFSAVSLAQRAPDSVHSLVVGMAARMYDEMGDVDVQDPEFSKLLEVADVVTF